MITLHLTEPPRFALDLSVLTPDGLQDLTLDQIKRLPLAQGRRRLKLGELFAVQGTADATLEITGVTPLCHRLGAQMSRGQLIVRGNCGDEVGRDMRGGTLQIYGNARDRVGAGMRTGTIEINGAAGDFVGASLMGATSGMKGGTIVVTKNVGARLGDRMRRGLIVVGGNAGAAAASQLIAGTLVVLGTCGPGAANGMRRGTLLARDPTQVPPSNFVLTGTFELPFLAVLAQHIARLKPTYKAKLRAFTRVERWVGDRGCGGLGELLIARAHR